MTLAPDHIGYHRPGEIDDPPARVSVIPARKWRHLTEPPEDAPALDNLPLARDLILTHLAVGVQQGDPWETTWAAIVIDIGGPAAIPYDVGRELIADYESWVDSNNGTFDWAPGDADELRTDITNHLTRAGYTERTP